MNHIIITDLFGNKINGTTPPFIILNTIQPHLLLHNILKNNNKNDTWGIWTLIRSTILHALYYNHIEPTDYAPLGSIWYNNTKLPNKFKILLVNTHTNISNYPIDYTIVHSINDINIWKPVNKTGYVSLGYIAAKNKPSLHFMKSVNKNIVMKTKFNNIGNYLTNMNEFFLLGISTINRYTINRIKLLPINKNIRLSSKINSANNIITNTDNKVQLKPYNYDFQDINYTVNGELKMGNNCLTTNNTDDNYVYLTQCNNNKNQQWYPYKYSNANSFVSNYDDSCLTNENGKLLTKKCDNNNNQSWYVEQLQKVVEDTKQDYYQKWYTKKGKKVILIEPNNPWYINKKRVIEPEGVIRQHRLELNKNDYDNAKYESSFMMDTNRLDMGYGHSYAERGGKPCACVEDCNKIQNNPKDEFILEHFDEPNNQLINSNYVSSTFIIIVVILIFIKWLLQ